MNNNSHTIPSEKPSTVEEQIAAVYTLVDELHAVEDRLRNALDIALITYKGDSPQ